MPEVRRLEGEPSPLTPRETAALTIEYALWRRERGLETRSTMPDAPTEYVTMPPVVPMAEPGAKQRKREGRAA